MIYKAELSIAERADAYDDKRIEASIHDDPDHGPIMLLNVVAYEDGSKVTTSTNEMSFPPISVSDLIRLLAAYGYAGASWHQVSSPYPPSEALRGDSA